MMLFDFTGRDVNLDRRGNPESTKDVSDTGHPSEPVTTEEHPPHLLNRSRGRWCNLRPFLRRKGERSSGGPGLVNWERCSSPFGTCLVEDVFGQHEKEVQVISVEPDDVKSYSGLVSPTVHRRSVVGTTPRSPSPPLRPEVYLHSRLRSIGVSGSHRTRDQYTFRTSKHRSLFFRDGSSSKIFTSFRIHYPSTISNNTDPVREETLIVSRSQGSVHVFGRSWRR